MPNKLLVPRHISGRLVRTESMNASHVSKNAGTMQPFSDTMAPKAILGRVTGVAMSEDVNPTGSKAGVSSRCKERAGRAWISLVISKAAPLAAAI
jgi:hypothetical protein